MLKEGLKFFTDTHITLIGLVLFMTLFVGIVLWVNRKSTKQLYSQISEMPLQGEGEQL